MCYHRFTLAMDRSLGFGSIASNLFALLRLAFASAPFFLNLTLLDTITRWPILQKVRHHPLNRALTVCRRMVSGSISLPFRGAFHLSLTVLFSIGR